MIINSNSINICIFEVVGKFFKAKICEYLKDFVPIKIIFCIDKYFYLVISIKTIYKKSFFLLSFITSYIKEIILTLFANQIKSYRMTKQTFHSYVLFMILIFVGEKSSFALFIIGVCSISSCVVLDLIVSCCVATLLIISLG
jgi:small basic protein